MKKTVIHFLVFLAFSLGLSAQTNLPETLDSNMVLTNESSPYIISPNLTIPSEYTLTIQQGVEIKIASGGKIIVQGSLVSKGSKKEPVIITSNVENEKWAYISGSHAYIELYNTNISNSVRFITANYGELVISNCKINNTYGSTGDDCIGLHYLEKVIIEFCYIDGSSIDQKIDAIDSDDIDSCVIRNNIIKNFGDDAIDIGTGSLNSAISYNIIENCNYGISIGENSIAEVYRNIVIDCDGGIQSHSGSSVLAYNNTLYKNGNGVECHHGSKSNSGGNATIVNTIFSQSKNKDYSVQDNSIISISYSLSDQLELPGDSNIYSNPLFVDPDNNIFKLDSLSPCINKGSINSPLDSNGYRIDIGAFEYPSILNSIPQIDTSDVPTDTTAVPPDTTELPQDTTEVPPDTTEVPQDTTGAPQDTAATTQDTVTFINCYEKEIKTILYPNPFSDILFLSNVKNYVVYSLEGRILMRGYGTKILMENFPNGVYFILIDNYSYKVIKSG